MELMATALGLRGLNSFTKLNSFRAPKSKVFNFMSAGQAHSSHITSEMGAMAAAFGTFTAIDQNKRLDEEQQGRDQLISWVEGLDQKLLSTVYPSDEEPEEQDKITEADLIKAAMLHEALVTNQDDKDFITGTDTSIQNKYDPLLQNTIKSDLFNNFPKEGDRINQLVKIAGMAEQLKQINQASIEKFGTSEDGMLDFARIKTLSDTFKKDALIAQTGGFFGFNKLTSSAARVGSKGGQIGSAVTGMAAGIPAYGKLFEMVTAIEPKDTGSVIGRIGANTIDELQGGRGFNGKSLYTNKENFNKLFEQADDQGKRLLLSKLNILHNLKDKNVFPAYQEDLDKLIPFSKGYVPNFATLEIGRGQFDKLNFEGLQTSYGQGTLTLSPSADSDKSPLERIRQIKRLPAYVNALHAAKSPEGSLIHALISQI